MVPSIDDRINFIRKTVQIVVDPPSESIMDKTDTGSTVHYSTQYDPHALVDVQPTKMEPRVSLPDNSTMDPQQVCHLPLETPPAATETHAFVALQNASLISVGQLCDDVCKAI